MSVRLIVAVGRAPFERMLSGALAFHLCQPTAAVQAGDVVVVHEDEGAPTGRILEADVTFVAQAGTRGLARGYVCLSLAAPRLVAGQATEPAEWEHFAKGKCKACGVFRLVDKPGVCRPCATGEACDGDVSGAGQ